MYQVAEVFPELKGKLNGHAIRVPMLNSSITDMVAPQPTAIYLLPPPLLFIVDVYTVCTVTPVTPVLPVYTGAGLHRRNRSRNRHEPAAQVFVVGRDTTVAEVNGMLEKAAAAGSELAETAGAPALAVCTPCRP